MNLEVIADDELIAARLVAATATGDAAQLQATMADLLVLLFFYLYPEGLVAPIPAPPGSFVGIMGATSATLARAACSRSAGRRCSF